MTQCDDTSDPGDPSVPENTTALRKALDVSGVGIFVLAPDFTVEWANGSIEEYFGVSRDRTVGEDKRDLLHSEIKGVVEDSESFADRLLATYENNTYAAEFTCHVLPGEGRQERWLLHQSHPIEEGRLAGGRIEQYTDITERETELERRNKAIEEAPIGVTMTDPRQEDNPLVYANDRFLELTGYSHEEVIGWNHRELQGPATREEPVERLRAAVDAEEPATVELRNYRADGTMFWNRVTVAPIHDETGTVTNWVGFQEDVTERKSRERELERTNERLDEFTTVVGHDLRNPLQVAEMNIDIARNEFDSERLERVARSVARMRELVDDLLELAQSSESVTELEPVSLSALAEACWDTVATEDARLVLETDARFRADPGQLKRLLENLVHNAVDHGSRTPRSQTHEDADEQGPTNGNSRDGADGGARTDSTDGAGYAVTVTVGTLADGTGFYVADDGSGIPEGERESVLEPGYSTDRNGTGFGLSIVREICRAHGWTLEIIESDAGGARFEVGGVDLDR